MPQLTLNNNDLGFIARDTINSNFTELNDEIANIDPLSNNVLQSLVSQYILTTGIYNTEGNVEDLLGETGPSITKTRTGTRFLFEAFGAGNWWAHNGGWIKSYLYARINGGGPFNVLGGTNPGIPVEYGVMFSDGYDLRIYRPHNFKYLWSPNDIEVPVGSNIRFYIKIQDSQDALWKTSVFVAPRSDHFTTIITELQP